MTSLPFQSLSCHNLLTEKHISIPWRITAIISGTEVTFTRGLPVQRPMLGTTVPFPHCLP